MAYRIPLVLLLCLLATGPAQAVVGSQPTRQEAADAAALSSANGATYHLLANCIGAQATSQLQSTRPSIERGIRALETFRFTASVAAQYRQSLAKIQEGGADYDQAKRANGPARARLIELGNQAMRLASALLDAAVHAFSALQPQLANLIANERHPSSNREIEIDSPFFDCFFAKEPMVACCEKNYKKAVELFQQYGYLWTADEKRAIRECINATLAACLEAQRNGTDFARFHWEFCFRPKLRFRPSPR